MWNVGCAMLGVGCGMLNVACEMLSGRAGCFYQKHGLHRCARMGLFTDSLLLLRCLPLGFDAPSAQRIDAEFFASGKLCGRMSHDGLAWYAKNLWKSARSVGDK